MDESARRLRLILFVVLLAIVIGGTADLILDRPETLLSAHVLLELTMVLGALATVTWLWLGWSRAERSVGELQRSLEERREERDRWKESAERALEGLGQAIDDQFRRWELTPSEREVALLLLKGYSHKAIARHTDRSPQTVRQHAGSVYAKAGLSGRAELAAYFLEDLILPDERREVTTPEGDG